MLALPALGAEAQGFEGTWRGGPVRMQVAIESWGRDCGPRPQSFTGEATGNVRISESGEQLVIHGTPQRRTDRCWSENRAVRRVSSTHDGQRWRVVCRTGPDDPRGETGTYTLSASGEDRLNYREVSDYDWQLNESRCKARMTVTQTFSRVGAPTPTPEEPTPEPPTCTPGEPARIRLRPEEAEIEPGGLVRFSARVVDSAGCPIRGRNIRWSLTGSEGANGTMDDGLFTAAENAAEAEGEFTIRASAGPLRAESTVVVRTADLSDLIARRATVGVTRRLPAPGGRTRARARPSRDSHRQRRRRDRAPAWRACIGNTLEPVGTQPRRRGVAGRSHDRRRQARRCSDLRRPPRRARGAPKHPRRLSSPCARSGRRGGTRKGTIKGGHHPLSREYSGRHGVVRSHARGDVHPAGQPRYGALRCRTV